MFVNRDKWHYAPVNERGDKQESFAGYQIVVKTAKLLGKDKHLADVGLLWDLSWNHAHLISRYRNLKDMIKYWMDFDGPKENKAWWQIFCGLSDTDTDFDLVEATVNPLDKQVLIYAGEEFVDLGAMREIARYVRDGGRLIAVTQLPDRGLTHQTDGEIERLKQELERSSQVIHIEPGKLSGALASLGAANYVHAEAEGVWSFAYRGETGYVVFIANTQNKEVSSGISFSEKLIDPESTYEKLDLVTQQSESVSGKALASQELILSGQEVQAWRLRKVE